LPPPRMACRSGPVRKGRPFCFKWGGRGIFKNPVRMGSWFQTRGRHRLKVGESDFAQSHIWPPRFRGLAPHCLGWKAPTVNVLLTAFSPCLDAVVPRFVRRNFGKTQSGRSSLIYRSRWILSSLIRTGIRLAPTSVYWWPRTRFSISFVK